jgi:tRNA A37 threonylcarbamoyladenosine synthetase subunit TsaC/SUA5/YrdC
LAQTSVNISGKPVLGKIKDIKIQFEKENILLVDFGDIKAEKSSKIVDFSGGNKKVIRS